jgi:hypothetical protein
MVTGTPDGPARAAGDLRLGHARVGRRVLMAAVCAGVVAAALATFGPVARDALEAGDISEKVEHLPGSGIASAYYDVSNGVFTFTANPGVDQARALEISCQVINPVLRGTQFHRYLVDDQAGEELASDQTPCP